jgi:hypothetical protein
MTSENLYTLIVIVVPLLASLWSCVIIYCRTSPDAKLWGAPPKDKGERFARNVARFTATGCLFFFVLNPAFFILVNLVIFILGVFS